MTDKEKAVLQTALRLAPYHKSILALCNKEGISRATLNRAMKNSPTKAAQIDVKLGTRYREIKKKDGKTISVSPKTGNAHERSQVKEEVEIKEKPRSVLTMELNHTERLRVAEQATDIVARGSTLGQACEIVGLNVHTFWKWASPTSEKYMPEVKTMYDRAKAAFNYLYDDDIQMGGKQLLSTLIKERELTSTIKIGKIDKATGEVTPTQIRTETKRVAPTLSAARFILEKMDASVFGTPQERLSAPTAQKSYADRTLAELDEEEQRLLKILEESDE